MVSGDDIYHSFKKKYLEIFTPSDTFETNHDTYHHIVTNGPSISCRPRHLDKAKLKAAKRNCKTIQQ